MENELLDERGSKTKAAPGLEPGRLLVVYGLSDCNSDRIRKSITYMSL